MALLCTPGRAESDHMWECLQQLLCEVDDGIDADKFGSDSTGKSWKDVDGDVKVLPASGSGDGMLQGPHLEVRAVLSATLWRPRCSARTILMPACRIATRW